MDTPFRAWGPDHLGALGAIGAAIAMAGWGLRSLSASARLWLCRVTAATCLVGLAAGSYVEFCTPGKTLADAVPIHLCSVSLFLTAVALVRRSPLAFEWIYIYGIAGVAQALATPDLSLGFPALKYLVFFFNHGIILVGLAYLIGVERMRLRPGVRLRLWLIGNAYMLTAAGYNALTGSNFGYLCRKPEKASLLDALGPWPWYVLVMEIIGTAMLLVLVALFPPRAEDAEMDREDQELANEAV